jgi:ABC-type branched-subunit amino acid transport system substrate-binding protein
MLAISFFAVAVGVAACSSTSAAPHTASPPSTSPSSPEGGGSSSTAGGPSPGVTPTSVTVGQVDDLSSPFPGEFISARDGTTAYIAYINSLGGVNGRKLVLDSQDSTFQGGVVETETAAQVHHDFALVGGFSILDSAEKPLIDLGHMPDITLPLDPAMLSDPYVYSPLPTPVNHLPLGFFKYLKQKYPAAVQKVGIIWENATSATTTVEQSEEAAMKAVGFTIVYDHGIGPFDTNFLPDIIHMKNAGVKMFISYELPDNLAATLVKQMQQQSFKPVNVEGAVYSTQFLSLAGGAANNMLIEQTYALYLGQDAKTIPAVKLFVKWVKKVDPKSPLAITAVYGWTSAELFVDALKHAGNPPTRAGLIAALNNINAFNTGGLIPPSDPGLNIPSDCFLVGQVQKNQIVRAAPTPATGFDCPANAGYLTAPGYKLLVRPTS